ncbi:hypothetical protein BCR34DRAFT_656702 [Clohesyomyces aquaticus]|uniref:Uncharacterized protein n=1 Tax=Clohesyomyces aquaticus TaxID=1231657 RepID=A0A1Y1ZGM7_9PLEO|nr:hypothetical protein BCR34DRAFT_656702 [Clohesyomyces aquaticus]
MWVCSVPETRAFHFTSVLVLSARKTSASSKRRTQPQDCASWKLSSRFSSTSLRVNPKSPGFRASVLSSGASQTCSSYSLGGDCKYRDTQRRSRMLQSSSRSHRRRTREPRPIPYEECNTIGKACNAILRQSESTKEIQDAMHVNGMLAWIPTRQCLELMWSYGISNLKSTPGGKISRVRLKRKFLTSGGRNLKRRVIQPMLVSQAALLQFLDVTFSILQESSEHARRQVLRRGPSDKDTARGSGVLISTLVQILRESSPAIVLHYFCPIRDRSCRAGSHHLFRSLIYQLLIFTGNAGVTEQEYMRLSLDLNALEELFCRILSTLESGSTIFALIYRVGYYDTENSVRSPFLV